MAGRPRCDEVIILPNPGNTSFIPLSIMPRAYFKTAGAVTLLFYLSIPSIDSLLLCVIYLFACLFIAVVSFVCKVTSVTWPRQFRWYFLGWMAGGGGGEAEQVDIILS